jgi:hypothetical protein
MNRYDARQQFIEGLDRYVSGIETDEGLERLAENVSANHDRLPYEACSLVCAIVRPRRRFTASYAGASEIVLERLRAIGREKGKPVGKWKVIST